MEWSPGMDLFFCKPLSFPWLLKSKTDGHLPGFPKVKGGCEFVFHIFDLHRYVIDGLSQVVIKRNSDVKLVNLSDWFVKVYLFLF